MTANIYANPVIAGGHPLPFFSAKHSDMEKTASASKLAKADGDSLPMTDNLVVPLARRRKDSFIEAIKKRGG